MIKHPYRILLIAFLVLVCTAFIFSNSLKNADESRADSDVIVGIVENIVDKIAPGNELDWNYIVRKAAHLVEFFVLGVFATLLSFKLEKKSWLAACIALLFAFVIACSDEFIQRFTGRGSCFSDVIIDVFGALIGVILMLLLDFALQKHRGNKSRLSYNN